MDSIDGKSSYRDLHGGLSKGHLQLKCQATALLGTGRGERSVFICFVFAATERQKVRLRRKLARVELAVKVVRRTQVRYGERVTPTQEELRPLSSEVKTCRK